MNRQSTDKKMDIRYTLQGAYSCITYRGRTVYWNMGTAAQAVFEGVSLHLVLQSAHRLQTEQLP